MPPARTPTSSIYVAAGEVTELARTYALENRVRIVEGAELMRLYQAGLL